MWECKSLPDATLKEAKYAPWKGSITHFKPKKWQFWKRQAGNDIDLAMRHPHKRNASQLWRTDTVHKPPRTGFDIALACWETRAAGTTWHRAARKRGALLYEQQHWPWFKKAEVETVPGSVRVAIALNPRIIYPCVLHGMDRGSVQSSLKHTYDQFF